MSQAEEPAFIQGMPILENFPIEPYKQIFRRVLRKTQEHSEKIRKEADEASNIHTSAKLEAMKPTLTPIERTEAEKEERRTLQAFENRIAKTNKINERYQHFVGGWSGTLWRFHSCIEHSNAYTEAFKRSGPHPEGYEAYLQDKALFGFFSCGLSAIECVCYSLYLIEAMIKPEKFPITEKALKSINPKDFAETYATEFHSKALYNITNSVEYRQWSEIRNVLTHASGTAGRTGIVRIVESLSPQTMDSSYQTESSGPSTILWVKDLPIDEFTTSSRLVWLKDTLNILVYEINDITKTI